MGLAPRHANCPAPWQARAGQPREFPINRFARQEAPEQQGPRINRQITARHVRLVGVDGQQVGIVSLYDALNMAADADLDLVEVAAQAEPPVCKILDFGKFKFEEQKKAAEARRRQKVVEVKEIQFRPGIDDHDYDVKMRAATRFLQDGDKVKMTLRFRGREMAHQDIGVRLLQRAREQLEPLAKAEQLPRLEGKQLIMVLAPR